MRQHVLLIGSDETKLTLRTVARILRDMCMMASCFFDDETTQAQSALESVHFLLISLSRSGREISSATHEREKRLIRSVADMHKPIPVGIIRDIDRYVSAPYLTLYSDVVRIVFKSPKQAVPPLFKNCEYIDVADTLQEAARIAHHVHRFMAQPAM